MKKLVYAAVTAICCSAMSDTPGRMNGLKPLILFNEDSDNMVANLRWRKNADRMTEDDVRAYYENVIGGGRVTHLLLCVNARQSAYPSKVFDNYWDGLKNPDIDHPPFLAVMKDLFDRGVDKFAIGITMCRAKGVKPWLSFRMNDVHSASNDKAFTSFGYWKEHPELWLKPSTSNATKSVDWWMRAFDYRNEQVQARMLAYIEEALERYSPDGIELDWMRFECHVPFKRVNGVNKACEDGVEALNRFMRRAKDVVRKAEKKCGHQITISVRVDSDPESALNHGTDYRTWARERLVDFIVPCNFFDTVDFDLPYAKWKDELKTINPDVTVIPGADCNVKFKRKRIRPLTADEYAAWGERMYSQGAPGIYFFNLFCFPVSRPKKPEGEVWEWVTRRGFALESVLEHKRSIPEKTFRECVDEHWCK